MINLTDEIKKEICQDSKNLWFSAVFYNVIRLHPNLTFEEQKEIFFALTEELLEKKIINFDHPPIAEYAGRTGVWEADTQTIIQYLKDGFPKHATHKNDMDVSMYFYAVAPAVAWLQDDGTYYGSQFVLAESSDKTGPVWTIDVPKQISNTTKDVEIKFLRK